ncbi:hypothetical protein [Sphaerotilus sp.]|uniref:hypothetical protein n=1 Tax=Sphaerotilus sp. TaxID=2093942 RepID=UPI0034E206AE
MSRRRKTSGADAVTDLVAKLPWWVGVVLAVVAYVGLHRLAVPMAATPLQPGQAGALVVRTLIQSMASVGQYLIPFFCLLGAALSAYRQRERRDIRPKRTP